MSCPTDAVIDLTMYSTAEAVNINRFTITCINGEQGTAQVNIRRDNKIIVFPRGPSFKVHKPRSKVAEARDFHDLDNVGIFLCESTQEAAPRETITMIGNVGSTSKRLSLFAKSLQLPPQFNVSRVV